MERGLSAQDRFDDAVSELHESVRNVLSGISAGNKARIQEVRLRAGQPLCVSMGGKPFFVEPGGKLREEVTGRCRIITPQEVETCFRCLCQYSVHTHQHEIRQGYVSLRGGHRAGVCGTSVRTSQGGLHDITSINLRIAREYPGSADDIIKQAFSKGLCSLILAGEPSSGKTTLLRDLARQLSCGATGRHYKVAVVDERSEIAAVHQGMAYNDMGPCCDILDNCPKGEGILMAVRTLSPDIIVCDEIGGEEETRAVQMGLNGGVRVVTTIHAGSVGELINKPQFKALAATGGFDTAVLLSGAAEPGKVAGILPMRELTERPALPPAGHSHAGGGFAP